MIRGSFALALLLALPSCRTYDYDDHTSDSGGLVPAEQMARYGREQAQAVAISRHFAQAGKDSALTFARTQPDVVNAVADPQSQRITVDFKSGWRLGVVPLAD
jgi:hypothetical protein